MDKSTRLSGYIYGLRLKSDPQVRYIGLTTGTVEKRFLEHQREAKGGRKYPVYDWMRSHGVENISCVTIEAVGEASEECLAQREIFHIAEARSKSGRDLLNVAVGGTAPFFGRKHSDIARQRISKALKGRPHSDTHNKAMGISKLGNTNWAGRKHSEGSKLKMSDWQIGVAKSPEHIAALSASQKGKPNRGAHVRHHENQGVSRPETCFFCANSPSIAT